MLFNLLLWRYLRARAPVSFSILVVCQWFWAKIELILHSKVLCIICLYKNMTRVWKGRQPYLCNFRLHGCPYLITSCCTFITLIIVTFRIILNNTISYIFYLFNFWYHILIYQRWTFYHLQWYQCLLLTIFSYVIAIAVS